MANRNTSDSPVTSAGSDITTFGVDLRTLQRGNKIGLSPMITTFIIIGVLLFLLISLGLIYLYIRIQQKKREEEQHPNRPDPRFKKGSRFTDPIPISRTHDVRYKYAKRKENVDLQPRYLQ